MTNIIKYLIILFVNSLIVLSQTNLNPYERITPEKVKQIDEYIKKYSPSDSAFQLMSKWADRYYLLQKAALSKYIYESYKPLFPNYESQIESLIKNAESAMLLQVPDSSLIHIYDLYIKGNAPSDNAFVVVQLLTHKYIENKMYDSAVKVYQYYSKFFSENDTRFKKVIDILSKEPEGILIRNLGSVVNSPYSEWDPNLTPDGKYLYFSSDRRGGYGSSDIWYSENINGNWSKPKNIGNKINNRNEETIDNVSTDGSLLFLSGEFPNTYGKFDIYIAERDTLGWSKLLHFKEPINSQYHDESANLSSDGKILLFTSDRPGGVGPYVPINTTNYHGSIMGNMDIYISFRRDTGWTAPINLGNVINTPYAERSVFLHPDNKTLYFSSNGHPGLGGLDIFKSIRLDDTWLNWSEPINLGKEINSESDDWGYSIDIKGDSAVFAQQNKPDGYGGWDIYSVKLPTNAKPSEVVTIRGKVTNSIGQPISAVIKWEDLKTGEDLGFVKSDPIDGTYFIVLPLAKLYGYYAEKPNYYPTSKNIDLRKIKKNNDYIENIQLISNKEISTNKQKIIINNIFFDYNKYELKPESLPELKRLIEFLKLNNQSILIEGYTDNVGSAEFNIELSKNRAQQVANYLIKNGIDSNRIKVKGWGYQNPITDNKDEEAKSKNRRVEFSLY